MNPAVLIPFVIAWNPQPVDSFRVWRGIDVVAVVSSSEARIDLPAGNSTLTVTAVHQGTESAHSEPFHIYVKEPLLTIQGSPDLIDWHPPTQGDTFFRIKKEY